MPSRCPHYRHSNKREREQRPKQPTPPSVNSGDTVPPDANRGVGTKFFHNRDVNKRGIVGKSCSAPPPRPQLSCLVK